MSTCLQGQLSTMVEGPGVSRSTVSSLNQPQPRVSFVRAPLNPVGSNTAISAAGPGGRTKQQGGQREGKHHSAQQVPFMWSAIRPCLGNMPNMPQHACAPYNATGPSRQPIALPSLRMPSPLRIPECRCHNTLELSRQPATLQATQRACCKARHSSSCRRTCSSRRGQGRRWLLPASQVSLYPLMGRFLWCPFTV